MFHINYDSRVKTRVHLGKRILCIDITEHMSFCLGNAVKYSWRADLKDDAIIDLKKAAYYVNRELSRRKRIAK